MNIPDEPSEVAGQPIRSTLQLAISMLVDGKADINAKAQLFSSGGTGSYA